MRVEGWEKLLNEHIAEGYRRGFAWGESDCALWCARWVFKVTGEDFSSAWEGKYKSERGAALLMKRRGFAGVEAIADSALSPVPVALAQRGDLVLDDGPLGICNGRYSFFLTEGSVTMRDTLGCAKAWKVG